MTPAAYAEPMAIRAGIARGNRKLNVAGRMSKFKVGDEVKVVSRCPEWTGWVVSLDEYVGDGTTYKIVEVDPQRESSFYKLSNKWSFPEETLELTEDRSNWHPHHDVIVAWAKGAKIRGRANNRGSAWRVFTLKDVPLWDHDWEYEVISEPDHTAEIAEIEQEMRKLSESQKELADRLEKLKGD